jgi:putative ABC transport system substrate-binding protein
VARKFSDNGPAGTSSRKRNKNQQGWHSDALADETLGAYRMQFGQLKRRAFITLLGGAAAAWPLAARAQQHERIRRVGVLIALEANDAEGRSELKALRQAFQELGWTEGRNLQLEIRWAGGEPARIQASAKELVTLPCEAILSRSTPATAALIKETRTTPIVFSYVVDPIGSGFVQSFPRPGGNVTGFQVYEFTMAPKWLELLLEIAPSVRRAGLIHNPATGRWTSSRLHLR